MQGPIRRPSPALIVAMVALVAALGGTAVGLPGKKKIDGNDLKKNVVGLKSMKNNSVGPAELKANSVNNSENARFDAGNTVKLSAAADQLLAADRDEVVVVTDPYHSLRSRLIAEEVGLDASLSPTPTSVVTGWSSFRRELEEAAGVAVGRIIGFERLSGLTG